ncbi:hypothetical protein [Rhodococcus sp. IEGM 1305]|uniref:hypothetical protein n=1 Tax=Rhodococcus sp. IEGM 1305 TaxID=3047092 RepID=UPI0024B84BB5|nr:hypothetical protein [Rhodococcus sp. IEGM 1305]MDI9952337.1 hypothetical protein [Rhodococcus sp. IEGM 1305]
MTAETEVDGVIRADYAHMIDLDDDRTAGQRYELSFRYTCRDGLLLRWSVQLVARCSASGHAETLFAGGRSVLEPAAPSRGDVAAAGSDDDFDTACEFYEQRWRALLDPAGGSPRGDTEQRHLSDALTLYGRTWRSGAGRAVADRLASFANVTVLALGTDPAFHVMRRTAAHYPDPVVLAVYQPAGQRIDLSLVDTATVEALIDDPGPLRTGPDTSAGALLTGVGSAGLLHPGYIGSTTAGVAELTPPPPVS